MKHSSTFLSSLQQECPIITKKALEALLPFSVPHLCEAGFAAMNTMKSKKRSRLQTLEEDLRVCLRAIRPRTRDSMRHHQAQVSQWRLYAYVYVCIKKVLTVFILIVNRKHSCSIKIFHHRAAYSGRACSTNGEKSNAYRMLVGKPEGERPLERPSRRWVDNIKMDLIEIGLDWSGSG
jgi:hypothetical protein